MDTAGILDYLYALLIAFAFLTLALWPIYYALRLFSLRVLPREFSYWPVAVFAALPFLFLFFAGKASVILSLPFFLVGGIAGYILEKLSIYLLNRKADGNYQGREIRIPNIRRGSARSYSKTASSSSSSRSGRSGFGGGGFSGGGGSGTW